MSRHKESGRSIYIDSSSDHETCIDSSNILLHQKGKNNMHIAPNYKTSDWEKLQLDNNESNDWETAINILETRIIERYFDPVDILIKYEKEKFPNKRRFGFTIIAIDCLLIETLQAFKTGAVKTPPRKGQKAFVRYLTESPTLSVHFTEIQAEQFYKNYRNGILHQAQVGGKDLIWSVGELVRTANGEMVINRTKFHALLRQSFDKYIDDLRDKSNQELRNAFRKKMDHICNPS